MSGLLEQLKAEYTYTRLTVETFEKTIAELMSKDAQEEVYFLTGLNTLRYTANMPNLDSVRKAKIAAQRNANIVKMLQGYKPKIKFAGIKKK